MSTSTEMGVDTHRGGAAVVARIARHMLSNPWPVRMAAVLLPAAVCMALIPLRDGFDNTNAALVLVLVVVGLASAGQPAAGVVSAVSAGVCFDFFLTEPYQSLAINDRDDIETAVLLLLVGISSAALAGWGRRHQAAASRDAGYLAGISAASEIVARGGTSPSDLISRVCGQLTTTLDLVACRFDYGTGLDYPRLHRNGDVVWRHQTWDIRQGVPATDKAIELYAESGGSFRGRFLFEVRPDFQLSQAQILVAASLADEVASALAEFEHRVD